MVDAAEARDCAPGGTIVEPTSGNTGAGLAIVAAQRGYKCIFVMSDKMSDEKVALLRAYGAEVVVCPTAVAPEDPRSYYSTAERLVRETPGAFRPDQYSNQANPAAHFATTGPEIWEQTATCLHFIGASAPAARSPRRPRASRKPAVQIIGADPSGSVYSGGTGRLYRRGRRRRLTNDVRPHGRRSRIEVSDADSFLTARRATRKKDCSSAARAAWARCTRGRARSTRRRRCRPPVRLGLQLPHEDLRRRLDVRYGLPPR
jgi:cystathionine beta-synthase